MKIITFILPLLLSACAASPKSEEVKINKDTADAKSDTKSGTKSGDTLAASPYRDIGTLKPGQILHATTGKLLSPQELIELALDYPIVFFGETHDSKQDHEAELRLLKGLHKERGSERLAIGLEMLRMEAQWKVDQFIAEKLSIEEFKEVWKDNWGDSFEAYEDILLFAREENIKILALNAPKSVRSTIRKQGAQSFNHPENADIPDADFKDSYHRAMVMAVLDGHKHGMRQNPENFYAMQVLWDEAMAEVSARFLQSDEGEDRQLLILAGGFHIRYGLGIPRRLFRRVGKASLSITTHAAEISPEKKDKLMDVELPSAPMLISDVVWANRYE
ncbi:ChaN family lipoprotein [Myxococcota bacterium]|nr:ChaN family lipoprotein [Myxococcota bacterium]